MLRGVRLLLVVVAFSFLARARLFVSFSNTLLFLGCGLSTDPDMNPLPDRIPPSSEASAADQRNRMQRVGISGHHTAMHLESTVDNDTGTLSSAQSQFFEPNNPFLAPPSRSRQSSSRQRQRQDVQQAPTHHEDDTGSLPVATNKTPDRKRVTVASSKTGQQEYLYHAYQASAPFDSSTNNWNTDGNIGYRNATLDDLKHARKNLKAWETQFKDTYGRAATLDDIAKDEVMGRIRIAIHQNLEVLLAEVVISLPIDNGTLTLHVGCSEKVQGLQHA